MQVIRVGYRIGRTSDEINRCQATIHFQKLVEAAFLSNNKDANSPLVGGAVTGIGQPPIGKPGVGLLETVGVRSEGAVAVLTLVRWVLLRERGT